ncbi:MAG: malonic semialdehyde reductase [Candidatus Nanopelagicales bacterium]
MTLTTDTVDHVFADAHTAYTFTTESVPDDALRDIYESVKWAPTAMNSQPLRISFVRSADARSTLEPHVSPGNLVKVRSAPVTAILAYDRDWHEHLSALMPFATDPQLAWQDRERRVDVARLNAAIQAGYFILAVRAHGLAAGPMGGFDRAGLDAAFFPDGRWRSLLLVNIGHPGPESFRPRMPRLDFEQAATLL